MQPIALLFGAGFGFMLSWARITDYDVIRNMLLFHKLDVYFMMGAAMVTSAIGVRLLRAAGLKAVFGGELINWTITKPARHHVYGSLLFGLGWGIAGTCPGPIAAQLGRGQWAALFTVAGVFTGVALFGYLKDRAKHAAAIPLSKSDGTSAGM
ncbi:MAG: DUF6691 family protein [Pseudomonadota bacterium]